MTFYEQLPEAKVTDEMRKSLLNKGQVCMLSMLHLVGMMC